MQAIDRRHLRLGRGRAEREFERALSLGRRWPPLDVSRCGHARRATNKRPIPDYPATFANSVQSESNTK
jgi:hypothetical protein